MSDVLGLVVTGTIEHLTAEDIVVSDRFRKREIVIRHVKIAKDREFENFYKIDFKNQFIDKIKDLSLGQVVTVFANCEGRKWSKEGKDNYFNTYSGWKVELSGSQPERATEPAQASTTKASEMPPAPETDDLPFN